MIQHIPLHKKLLITLAYQILIHTSPKNIYNFVRLRDKITFNLA